MKKRRLGITLITRWREDLAIDSNAFQPVSAEACNAGVQSDQRVTLASSRQPWRLVEYRTRRGRGHRVETVAKIDPIGWRRYAASRRV